MPSKLADLPERHNVIVVYLIIVFAFLMLAFGVWAYFDYRGLQLRLQDDDAQHGVLNHQPNH